MIGAGHIANPAGAEAKMGVDQFRGLRQFGPDILWGGPTRPGRDIHGSVGLN